MPTLGPRIVTLEWGPDPGMTAVISQPLAVAGTAVGVIVLVGRIALPEAIHASLAPIADGERFAPIVFQYDIAMGVRKQDHALQKELSAINNGAPVDPNASAKQMTDELFEYYDKKRAAES